MTGQWLAITSCCLVLHVLLIGPGPRFITVFDNRVPPQLKAWPKTAPLDFFPWLRPCAQATKQLHAQLTASDIYLSIEESVLKPVQLLA